MLIVRSAVKEVLKDNGIGAEQISQDFLNRLDKKVEEVILESAKRAKENNRRTVMGRDV
jgi:histone H3/H4